MNISSVKDLSLHLQLAYIVYNICKKHINFESCDLMINTENIKKTTITPAAAGFVYRRYLISAKHAETAPLEISIHKQMVPSASGQL
jgi:hypothetical protein